MKLGADNETLAENKVLILYLLSTIDKAINNDSLYRLVLSVQEMNYFYFQQFLLDLAEEGYIITYEKENSEVYEITKDRSKYFKFNFRYVTTELLKQR